MSEIHRAIHVVGTLLHVLAVWRWSSRLRCHGSVECCQRVDWPNCNGSNHGRHFIHVGANDE